MLEMSIQKKLPDFSLDVAFRVRNETLVLFGPSGAGKSLTLSSIAGLTKPDSGFIRLGEQTLFRHPNVFLPVHRRGIGIVFQGYALFPHMTVAQNVAYGLRYMQGHGARVMETLARLRLDDLAHRYPHQLSGGQQQRVALGRALIVRPSLLLLDEPFSALDMVVREQLQADIVQLQQELDLTVLVITHSLEDAFALGDSLAVLDGGRILQSGSIGDVFSSPKTATVAKILGISNIWQGTVTASTAETVEIAWGQRRIVCAPAPVSVGETITFFIRPEDVKIVNPEKPLFPELQTNLLDVKIIHLALLGKEVAVTATAPNLPAPIQLRFPPRAYRSLNLREGLAVRVSLRKDAVQILPSE